MKKIILLTDYMDRFGSKNNAIPYRSGMNRELITKYFYKKGFNTVYLNFTQIDFSYDYKDIPVLYTSSEDPEYYYKQYIEDIILGLTLKGVQVIPGYKFLRANNNKTFMEILRILYNEENKLTLSSKLFGTIEEYNKYGQDYLRVKKVFKSAEGAMSQAVELVKEGELINKKSLAHIRSRNIISEMKDIYRKYRYQGFIPESKYRKKFIIQEYLENLENDWKVLIYNDKYYVTKRYNRKGDFRASGSKIFEYESNPPAGLLDYSKNIFKLFKVPNLSIDLVYKENKFYMTEFQALFFGTKFLDNSNFHHKYNGKSWDRIDCKSILEEVYVESIVAYLESIH